MKKTLQETSHIRIVPLLDRAQIITFLRYALPDVRALNGMSAVLLEAAIRHLEKESTQVPQNPDIHN